MDVLNTTWASRARQLANLDGPDFLTRWKTLQTSSPEWSDEALRLRYRHQVGEFLRYTLPEVFAYDWNAFHRAVLSQPKHHWSEQTEVERRLNLAPRGVGKSTLKKGDVAHSIVYGLRRFIVVIAATKGDSESWASTLRGWFGTRSDDNARLHDLYGPFTITGKQDRFTVTTRSGTKTTIWCASTSTSLQGANEDTHRPDEVVLDDWEARKHVRSESMRKQWQQKLNSEILKLKDRTRGAVFEALDRLEKRERGAWGAGRHFAARKTPPARLRTEPGAEKCRLFALPALSSRCTPKGRCHGRLSRKRRHR